jgi:hypothetical protein
MSDIANTKTRADVQHMRIGHLIPLLACVLAGFVLASQSPVRAEPPWSVLRSDVTVTVPQSVSPDAPLRTVTVAVEPNPVPASGNGAYFDIGPLAMKLCARALTAAPCGMTIPSGLRVRDILWFRLHKTGAFDRDGAPGIDWYVGTMTVTVNGLTFPTISVHHVLAQHHPVFLARITQETDAAKLFTMALSLRCNAHPVKAFAQAAGFLSTPLFKLRGISGWKNTRVPTMLVHGVVYRAPVRSTDGLATIDVAVTPPGPVNPSNLAALRFMRVEYLWQARRLPELADIVDVSGPVVRDTDDEGWFEVHPTKASEVQWREHDAASRALVGALVADQPECR